MGLEQNTWVQVYSYQYWSDIDWNRSGDGITYQPWIETIQNLR